jgi:hypothetical protein
LETVAKAIEYSQARDVRALLAYSASEAVAKQMVGLMPPSVFSSGGTFHAPKSDRQTVDLDDGQHLRFILEKRNGHWLVVQFLLNPPTGPSDKIN